jgi:hypothetical protein
MPDPAARATMVGVNDVVAGTTADSLREVDGLFEAIWHPAL